MFLFRYITQILHLYIALIIAVFAVTTSTAHTKTITLLNSSYDPTREFFHQYNHFFQHYWKQKTGQDVIIYQSHSGSGKQARAIIDGMQADIATLALAGDIDAINKYHTLLTKNWQDNFPNHSVPYTSTIVFLVRKGNPKHIHDWNDLVKPDIAVITPNPKTSGGARWNFLAAWLYSYTKNHDPQEAYDFVKQLYKNVPILDAGARNASLTFTQRNIGDVLISWENEAYMATRESGAGQFEVITPSTSILTEPPVALIDTVIDQKKTREVAKDYLLMLYSDEGQKIAAQNYYRPINPRIASHYIMFRSLHLLKVNDFFKNWAEINQEFFKDHAIFDQIIHSINQ